MINGGGEAAHMLEWIPSTPPEVRPAAKKLLLNGVGAGIMEREATKSRWPRLGQSPSFECKKRERDDIASRRQSTLNSRL